MLFDNRPIVAAKDAIARYRQNPTPENRLALENLMGDAEALLDKRRAMFVTTTIEFLDEIKVTHPLLFKRFFEIEKRHIAAQDLLDELGIKG